MTTEFLNTPVNSKVYEITDPAKVTRVVDTDVSPTTITCGFADATVARKLVVASPSSSFSIVVMIATTTKLHTQWL